jgi:long-subunit fatty acid transport protein
MGKLRKWSWGPVIFLAFMLSYVNAAHALTNSEVNAAFQFNFNNPGSRAAGMGGAFISQADDATAAYANPAGLVNLVIPEASMELKYNRYTVNVPNYQREMTNYEYKFDGSGSRDFTESVVNSSFASFVYCFQEQEAESPDKAEGFKERIRFAIYRHELVNYESDIHTNVFDMGGKRKNAILPTQSAVDLNINDIGISAAFKLLESGKLNIGATIRFSQYEMRNSLKRYGFDINEDLYKVNYGEKNLTSRWSVDESDSDISFIAGIQFKPVENLVVI